MRWLHGRTLYASESATFLADVSDIFYFFFAWGRGRGSPGRQGGGGSVFLLKIPGEGGGGVSKGGGREEAGKVCLRGIWGGGG